MRVNGFGVTDPGLVRDNNEDCILVDDTLGLYVVCDGMGGHAAGEVASSVALRAIQNKIARRHEELRSLQASGKLAFTIIRDVIRYACAAVYYHSAEHPRYRGMGTTTTMMLVQGSRAIVGHVGDSRLYLFRRGVLTQMTRDHTLGQDLLDSGELSESDLHRHSQAGALTRAVGVYEDVEVDTFQFELLLGDRVLLCSDGLYDAIPEVSRYVSLLAPPEPAGDAPQKLVALANREGGGPDNISALVISIEADADKLAAEETRRDRVLLSIDAVKRLFLFEQLDTDELLEVAGMAVLQLSHPHDIVLREGDDDDGIYLLVDGTCALKRGDTLLAQLKAGSHFGEMSLLVGGPRSATVTAETECTMLRISRSDFQGIIQRRPTTGVKLLLALGKELSKRLQKTNERMV
jgi:serine/threonine protein phosphatase PrpC